MRILYLILSQNQISKLFLKCLYFCSFNFSKKIYAQHLNHQAIDILRVTKNWKKIQSIIRQNKTQQKRLLSAINIPTQRFIQEIEEQNSQNERQSTSSQKISQLHRLQIENLASIPEADYNIQLENIFIHEENINQMKRNEINNQNFSQLCLTDQYFSLISARCKDCIQECQGCIETNCIGCKYGQNVNGKCLKENEKCVKGYFLDQFEKICKPCDVPFCLECSQSKQCLKCTEGFILNSYQSQCIVDQNQQLWEKYYKYTCPSLFIENQGDCVQKSICSSFKFQNQNKFDGQINKIIEFQSKNYIIGISSTQAILFEATNMSAIKELLNLYSSQAERLVELIAYKQYVFIFSNQNIYAINLDYQGLESRFQYTNVGSNIDQDYRKVYIDEQKLQMSCFVLTNNQKNIRLITINIVLGTKISFSIAQISDKNSGLLIQNEAQIILHFQIFQYEMILVYVSESQINFFDLQKMQQQQNLNFNFNFQKNIVVMISKNSKDISSVLTFYVLAQVEMVNFKLNALKVKLDKQNPQSTTWSSPQYNFEYFTQNQGLNNFQSFNWFSYEFENEIYFLLLAYQVQNSSVLQDIKFIGIADADYFFTGNKNYLSEYTGKVNWFNNQMPMIFKIQQSNNLFLIIPYQNSLQFFEIIQNTLQPAYQTIYFDQDYLSIKIQASSQVKQRFLLILDQILAKMEMQDDKKTIQINLSSKTLFSSKSNFYLGQIQNSKLFLPLDINQSQKKYLFLIFDIQERYRMLIIQTQYLINGNQILKAQIFISYQQRNEVIQQCDLYDEKEIILITTNLGIYQVSYHTLKLQSFIPIQNKLIQNQNIIFQTISSQSGDSQKKLQLMIIQGNSINGQNIIADLGDYSENKNQKQVNVNKLQRQFIYFIEYSEDQICQSLIIYYFGAYVDAAKQLGTNIIITSIQFIDIDTIGIVIRSPQDTFFKIFVQKKDELNLNLIITQTSIPSGFSCNVYEYILIATCYKKQDQDTQNQYIAAYVFDWQNISFILDQNGDKLYLGMVQLKSYEILNLDHQSIIKQENMYHIYSTFRQSIPGSQTLLQIEVISCYYTFDFKNKLLNFISLYYNIVQTSSQYYYSYGLIDYTDKISGFQRIFSPISFYQRFSFLNYGQVNYDNTYVFSQASSLLMFRQKNTIIAAQRFGQFSESNISTNAAYLFSIDELGIFAVLSKDDKLQFLSIDNLQILQSMQVQAGAKIFYSKKFQKLILNSGSIITVYDQDNLFEKQIYSKDLKQYSQKPTNLICFILNETSYIACNKFGLFDFQNQIFFENFQLIVCDSRQISQIYENSYYTLFNIPNNLFVFSHQKKKFLKNQVLSDKKLGFIKIILHKEISDQVILIDNYKCKIFQLPDFYLIFDQTQKYQNQNEQSECFYNPYSPSIILRTIQKLTIYKLPYSISNVQQTFNLNSTSTANQYIATSNYLYIFTSQRMYDQSKEIQFEQINLNTGNYKVTNMILTEGVPQGIYQYWEEKEIIFSNEFLISTGDITLGWSSEQKFIDYFERFNYIVQIDQIGMYQVKSLDFCEMFPFNKQSSQFIDTIDSASSNYYFLNQGVEQIIYFNSEQFLIQQSSFGNANYQTLISIYDVLLNKDYQDKFQPYYKSLYKIFPINSQNDGVNLYGFHWKCNLFIFQKDYVIEIIDLSIYKCQIYQFDKEVYFIQGNQLYQAKYQNQKIQIEQKQIGQNTQIQNLFSDQLNKWILILYDQQNTCVLYLNGSQQLKSINMNIDSQKISLVNFITYEKINLLIIGQFDSAIQIFQLFNPSSDQINTSVLFQTNLQCGQIKMIDGQVFPLNEVQLLVSIYLTCTSRIFLFQGTYDKINQNFINPIQLITYNLIHSRSYHRVKILLNNYVAVYSQRQVTIYSTSLQYIARVEDSLISQITDVILAPNMFNLIIVETNNIIIYSLKIMNKKQRLVLQINFPYLMPIIYSVKQLSSYNNILEFKGIDAKDILQFQYLPYYGQSDSQQSNNCVQQIESLYSKEEQQQQYISLLLTDNGSSNSTIDTYLSVQKSQEILLLTIVNQVIDFQQQQDILSKKINIDVNLNSLTLYLMQNEDSINYKNLFNSIKITNGVIKVNQTISLQNFEQFILQDVQIIFQEQGQIFLNQGNNLGFNNCSLIFQNKNLNNANDIFVIKNVENTIINQINITNQIIISQSIFNFNNCSSSLFKQLNIFSSQFNLQFPILKFQQQNQNIILQNFQVTESKLGQLLFLSDTQNISLQNFLLSKVNFQKTHRMIFIQQLNQEQQIKQLPFIYSEFGQKEINVSEFNIFDSSFSGFLLIQNWKEEIQTINNQQLKTYNISSLSSSSLRKISIQKSNFQNYSISIDDNKIMLDDIQFTQVQDGLIQIKNAQLNVNKLNVDEFTLLQLNSLFISINCVGYFQNIQIQKTDFKYQAMSNEDMQQIDYGYFYFKNTSALIQHFYAKDNNIQAYFLYFNGFNSQFQQLQADNSNSNNDVYIEDCIIQRTNKGGGIMMHDIDNGFISKSKIMYNQGSNFGGGMQMIKCSKVILQDVEIIGNKAYLYGGGIYLKDSNLQLISCKVQFNSAIVGGGIRFLNSILDTRFNQNDYGQVTNNSAIVYGNNQCSLPKKVKIKYGQNGVDKIIIATSSSNQQLTKINFQIIDEEQEIVKLPNRLNINIEDFNSQEISNYLDRFQLSLERKKNLILILQQDLDEFYYFNLFSDSDASGQTQIQQKNSFSQYNQTDKYTHQLNKYILQSGYSKLVSNDAQNQIYKFYIKSQGNLFNIEIQLKFRKCIQGEIINKVGQDFYECYLCSNNTYSLADPYSNTLLNSCKECPQGAQSCFGSQIIPQEGYWIQENYPNIYYCLNTYYNCIYNTATNNSCSEGYTGPLCESCRYHQTNSIGEIQYFSKKGKYKCAACANKVSQRDEILLTVFLGLIFLGYLTYQIASNYKKKVIKMKLLYLKRAQILYISNSLNSNEKSSFALKILISYMQIISVIFQLKIQTPQFAIPFQYFGNNLQTTVYSLDCVFLKSQLFTDISMVYVRLIWTLLQPFLYILFLLMFYCFASTCIKIGTQNRVKNLYLSGLLKIYYMFYPGIIQIVIGTISCKEFNGQKYVLNDLQFKCYDKQYNIFNYVFGLPLLILTLIIPSLILRKLVKSKEHIYQDPNIFISYGFYFSEYNYKYCFWEIIKIYQKIIVFILIGIFNDNTSLQVILVSIIIILYMRFQLHIQPYTYLQFNKLDHLSQITAAVTILCLSIYSNSDNMAIQIICLLSVSIANFYFFGRFIKSFSYHLIRQHNFKFFLDILIKIQRQYPNCIPEIDDGRVNILRQTKNWKNLFLAFSRRSYKGVYSYTNQMKQQSKAEHSFVIQDKIQYSRNKRMQLSIFKSQEQNLNNNQESERVLNTNRRLLTQDDNYFDQCQKQVEKSQDQNLNHIQESERGALNTNRRLLTQDDNYFDQFQKQVEKDKDSNQMIEQEILNYNSVRAHNKLIQPGKQLKLLQTFSQIPDEIIEILPNKNGNDQNNQQTNN
ncbi:hypothetical protein ABPG74_004027 [Tetrahymena malaccensis]